MTTPSEFRPVLFAVFWKSGIALGRCALHKPDAKEQIGGSAPAGVLHHHRRHVCRGGSDAYAATLDSGDAALVPLPAPRARGCGRVIAEFADDRRCYGTNSAG